MAMRPVLLASVVLVSLGSAAGAQAPEPAAPPAAPPSTANVDLGSPVIEALEVFAPPPGPALWKVTKGQSEVIVLGGITPLPHSLAWDTGRVDRALDGAKVLLTPPKVRIGAFDLVKMMVGGAGRQTSGKPLEETLPQPLRDRFIGARTAALKDARRYAKWQPFVAGLFLIGDYREAAGLSAAKPGSTVAKLAAAHRVPVRPMGEYRAGPILKEAKAITEAASLACLEDAVEQVQLESDHAQAAAKAWASGDLKGVKANYSAAPMEKCLQGVPSVATQMERGTADSARAIMASLGQPGKAVAVIDMNFLLRPNGVLDRLRAQGATITVPAG